MKEIRIILFDIDGVLIRLPHYFSQELERKNYQDAVESLRPFYEGGDNDCLEGRADTRKIIKPYLEKFGWQGTAEDYLSEQFEYERKYLDKKLIILVRRFRRQGIKCYLCTDQEKYRAKFLLNDMGFKNIFDGYFISCYVGFRKCRVGFWALVLKELKKDYTGLKSNQIAFFDDRQENLDAAAEHGIKTFLFKDKPTFEKDLAALNSA